MPELVTPFVFCAQMSPISPFVLSYQAVLLSPTSMSVIASESSCDDVPPRKSASAPCPHPCAHPLPGPMSGMTEYGTGLPETWASLW
jgi:hypothetical protein